MERTTTMGGSSPLSGNVNPLSNAAADAKIQGAAQSAHQTVDKVAGKTTTGVDRLSGAAHRAVDTAADAATSTAEWASSIPEQALQVRSKVTEAASASIRARPIGTVVGALVIGYLLGRLGRR